MQSFFLLALLAIATKDTFAAAAVEHSARAVAAVTDVATTGFATMNGSTSSGKGGKTVTVTSLSQVADAAKGSDPKVIMVSGTLSGAQVIKIGSNKSRSSRRTKTCTNDFR